MVNHESNGTNGQPSLKDRVRELRLGDRLSGVKSRGSSTSWLPWTLCIMLSVSWALVGFRWYSSGGGTPRSNPGSAGNANNAKNSSANTPVSEEKKPGEILLERKGYIIAAHQIAISPIGVEGLIKELPIVEGKEFKQGSVLAVIESTTYQGQLAEAKANAAGTKARFLEAESNLENEINQSKAELAQVTAQRDEAKLVYFNALNTPREANPKEDREQKEQRLKAAERTVEAYQFKLKQINGESRQERIKALKMDWDAAEARVITAQWRLDNCRIKAPVTGIILSKKAEIGSLLNPVVGGVSTSLCEMADLSDLEIELEVEERDVSKVKLGLECIVKSDAYPNRPYEAYVLRIMPIANRGKGILPVRIKIVVPKNEEQGRYLKPEMNALVSIFNTKSKHFPPELEDKTEPAPAPAK